jgi:hypothetical protein
VCVVAVPAPEVSMTEVEHCTHQSAGSICVSWCDQMSSILAKPRADGSVESAIASTVSAPFLHAITVHTPAKPETGERQEKQKNPPAIRKARGRPQTRIEQPFARLNKQGYYLSNLTRIPPPARAAQAAWPLTRARVREGPTSAQRAEMATR